MKSNDFLSPIVVKSAVQIVIDRLTQGIIDGQLTPGSKIPTEPVLADSFGVGRNTVREAVRILVAYGVLEIRRPEGTFVCDTFQPQGINPILYGLILQKDNSYDDLVGLRECIETGTMLCLMSSPLAQDQVERLHQFACNLERAITARPIDIDRICEADNAFHDAIAIETKNRLIIYLNDMVKKLSYASRKKIIQQLLDDGKQEYLIDVHYDLLEKMQGDDLTAMHNAIRRSYFYWKDVYKT